MARETTLNVSLTGQLKKFIQTHVVSGRYESASEVVRDALRALEQRDKAAFWADARDKLAKARDDVAAGRVLDGPKAMQAIRDRLHKSHDRKSSRGQRR